MVGHISVNNHRSYNFLHIGHHKDSDAQPKTAFNILACDLVSIEPVFNIQNVTADDSFSKIIEIGSDITEINIEK